MQVPNSKTSGGEFVFLLKIKLKYCTMLLYKRTNCTTSTNLTKADSKVGQWLRRFLQGLGGLGVRVRDLYAATLAPQRSVQENQSII